MKHLTLEGLRARTPEERWQMYKNAQRRGGPEAEALIALIHENQLSMRENGGFPEEHPAVRLIHDVCSSPEGIAAAIRATEEGLPALAYVDPMLQAATPIYHAEPEIHRWAGELMARVMEQQGYRRTARHGKLPVGCSAKTAMIFELRSK